MARCSSSRIPPAAASASGRRSRSWRTSPRRSRPAASATSGSGFCLDTAHAWGAGYRLSDPDATDALLAAFDARLGIGRLRMVHLNDSKSELGSHTDRHEHVGAGQIGEAGMAHILRHPSLASVTYFIETPGMDEGYDAINIARARALAAGHPLEPLPPGAMNVRGSRARSAPAADAELDSDPAPV